MSVLLADLLKKTGHIEIQVVAGQDSLEIPVSWAHIVETCEASKFLFKNEIAFITGLGLTNEYRLLDLIKDIHKSSPSAILVNVGHYINEIDEECVSYCNTHSLPLLSVPWDVHLSVIIKDFCYQITSVDWKNTTITSAFKNAIHFPKDDALYVVPLWQNGFDSEFSYSVSVIKYDINNPKLPDLDFFSEKIYHSISYEYPHFICFSNDDTLLLVVANIDEDGLREYATKIKNRANEILGKNEFYVGVGRLTKSIRCVYKSYRQATHIISLSEKSHDNTNFIYSDMGLYRLLIGIEDEDIINDYLNRTLVPLIKYDNDNDSNLVELLHTYLSHNGSVKETSEELFIHRNTTLYKIHKIEEILDMDLSLLDTRTQLILAYSLYNMCSPQLS